MLRKYISLIWGSAFAICRKAAIDPNQIMIAAIAVNQFKAEKISAKQIKAANKTSLRSPPAIRLGRPKARDNGVLRKLTLP